MINTNPNLIWVIVKHAVFKNTLSSDGRCFGLSLINNPRHLILKALKDIAPPHPSNHEPIMLFLATTILLLVKDLNTGAILLMGEPTDGYMSGRLHSLLLPLHRCLHFPISRPLRPSGTLD
ncbi:hypothetical protein CK203_104822 [Vitis vinifera]|uniref:Uncharacterized protein n=1 Tax=Vitis vinifera TaxID=29760 RepID=A0A438DN83_VITVI|nr:hypothetical protein CK203_104822 [Vitis vinifera]